MLIIANKQTNLRVPEWQMMQLLTFWYVEQDSQDSYGTHEGR